MTDYATLLDPGQRRVTATRDLDTVLRPHTRYGRAVAGAELAAAQ